MTKIPFKKRPKHGTFALQFVLAFMVGAAVPVILKDKFPSRTSSVSIEFRIIDGDTIDLAGERIRLDGIDAPEMAQSCEDGAGQRYACGKAAAKHLTALAASGPITCEGDERDTYGRRIATCFANGVNLNEEMVRSGQALAFRRYSQRYVEVETDARNNELGLWSGNFTAPWDYRKNAWIRSSPLPQRKRSFQ